MLLTRISTFFFTSVSAFFFHPFSYLRVFHVSHNHYVFSSACLPMTRVYCFISSFNAFLCIYVYIPHYNFFHASKSPFLFHPYCLFAILSPVCHSRFPTHLCVRWQCYFYGYTSKRGRGEKEVSFGRGFWFTLWPGSIGPPKFGSQRKKNQSAFGGVPLRRSLVSFYIVILKNHVCL